MPTLVNNLRAIRGPVTAVPMVGQSGVVVEPDTQNNQVVVRADETVLWENSNGVNEDNGFTVSEPFANFKKIRYIGWTNGNYFIVEVPVFSGIESSFRLGVTCMCADNDGAPLQIYGKSFTSNNGLTYVASRSEARWFDYTTTAVGGVQPFWGKVYKIVGINRIANN